jgi:hypothetical protein
MATLVMGTITLRIAYIMIRDGDVLYQGRSKNGLVFRHNNAVTLSNNYEMARVDLLQYSTTINTSLGYISITDQPWPTKLQSDPLELLQSHTDNDIPLTAVTLPRPQDKITTLDLSAPVIMLNSMYSEAHKFKLSGGQETEIKDQGIVYGDNLVNLLKWMLDVLRDHTHPPNSPPQIPVQVFADAIYGELAMRRTHIDKIGSEYNILNYFVRSK